MVITRNQPTQNHAKTNVSYPIIPPGTPRDNCSHQWVRNARKFGALCFPKTIALIFVFTSDLPNVTDLSQILKIQPRN